ncbi:uncharacterized protein V1516DRAFT_675385 [Lipomyces oligophaga]|uniref:uncharacterized protein n=1 Tax=Lipomyces oligophaga TaxID=45792 RepID=UPI0034CF5A14
MDPGERSNAVVASNPPISYLSTQSTEGPKDNQSFPAVISKPPTLTILSKDEITRDRSLVKPAPGSTLPDTFGISNPNTNPNAGSYRRRKKRRMEEQERGELNWDDDYDPRRPNNYEEYKNSEEQYLEEEDWREFLIGLQKKRSSESEQAPVSLSASPVPEASADEPESALSRTDVMYRQPNIQDQPRLITPKETFAKRLLSKYGWTPGQGLGATNTGITKPLRFSADKSKKGHGKIIDSSLAKDRDGNRNFIHGLLSKVVVLRQLIAVQDVDEDLAGEIGSECDSKYGSVERVYVHESNAPSVDIYIKFSTESSALAAVNGLNGRLFNGSAIVAQFYNELDYDNTSFS